MAKLTRMGVLCASAALLIPLGVDAQESTSNFARDRNVSVRERSRPEYEALGVRAGAFMVYPRLSADVIYSDNIYAAETNEVDDLIYRVRPEVSATSNWSRHALGAFARASINQFSKNTDENTTDFSVGVNGRLDIVRGSEINGQASYQDLTESRSSPTAPGNAAEPVRYKLGQFDVGAVREFNRLRLTGHLTFAQFDYQNAPATGGGSIFQQDRDRDEWVQSLKAEYAVSPATSVFVVGALNQRNYRLGRPTTLFDRDSDGGELALGSSFDIGALFRGEVQVGYMTQSYQDPRFSDIKGLAVRGSVDWFPSELTTVNLALARTVEEAASPDTPGFLYTSANLRVDHELLRNLLLTGQFGYGFAEYEQIDRSEKTATLGASATYLLNRRWGLTGAYTYTNREAEGVNRVPSFTENRLAATVTLQF